MIAGIGKDRFSIMDTGKFAKAEYREFVDYAVKFGAKQNMPNTKRKLKPRLGPSTDKRSKPWPVVIVNSDDLRKPDITPAFEANIIALVRKLPSGRKANG